MNTETVWGWLPTLTGWALKSLVVFALCGLALLALRRASASARHLVCLLTLAGLLMLPILSLALPGWRLAVSLPAAVFGTQPISRSDGFPIPVRTLTTLPSEGRVLGQGAFAKTNGFVNRQRPFLSGTLPSEGRVVSVRTGIGNPFLWPVILSACWLLGFVAALLRPLLGFWGIVCLSRSSQIATDASLLEATSECASALNLTQKPLLRQADAPVPMTWGDRHSVILLPAEAHTWPSDRLQAVLLHETAHIRRRDWLSHRFADMVCALYWFHPLVWLTARRLRAESEIACDDLVLTSGIAAPDYARHLLAVARTLRPAAAALPRTAIAMARTAQIEGRLKMILDNTRSRRALTRRVLFLMLGLSAVIVTPLAVLRPSARAAAPTVAFRRHQFTETVYNFLSGAPTSVTADSVAVQLADVTSDSWHDPGQRRVHLTFRIPPTAQDVTIKYELTDSLYSASAGTWQSKMQSTAHQTEAQLNPQTNGSRIVTATFPASVSKTNVRVGIAAGSWKVIGTARRHGSRAIEGLGLQYGHTGYIFSPLAETKEGTMLTISVNAATGPSPEDLRIVALDGQDRQILPTDIGDRSIGALDQITAHFALPPAQISELRLESRPFRYVEFKNVALKPKS